MRDVAARAGVSTATVSLVFSHQHGTRVSQQTRQRVLEVAAGLGYERPSPTSSLGWVTVLLGTDPLRGAALDLFGGVIEYARQQEHGVLVIPVGAGAEERQAAAATFARCPAELVVYVGADGRAVDPPFPLPARSVFVNCTPRTRIACSGGYPSVLPDDRGAASHVADVLRQQGHRTIAVVSDDSGDAVRRHWEHGLQRAAQGPDQVLVVATAERSVRERWLRHLLAKAPELRPTALVCTDASSAGTALDAAAREGRCVPDDLVIVVRGEGGNRDQAPPGVPLTSVALPAREMGRCAIKLLLPDGERRRAATALTPGITYVPFPRDPAFAIARVRTA